MIDKNIVDLLALIERRYREITDTKESSVVKAAELKMLVEYIILMLKDELC